MLVFAFITGAILIAAGAPGKMDTLRQVCLLVATSVMTAHTTAYSDFRSIPDQIDLRYLSTAHAGNTYGEDIIVAGSSACQHFLSIVGAPRCSTVLPTIVISGGGNYSFVGTAAALHMAPAESRAGTIVAFGNNATFGFLTPSDVAVDNVGNVYVADTSHRRVFRAAAGTYIFKVFAGTGIEGSGGDGGLATSAQFKTPSSLAFDAAGNVYVLDSADNRVRKVSVATGLITPFAGTGVRSYGGDGGVATSASFYEPHSVAVDISGNVIISEWGNCCIRNVSITTGIITTVTGTGYYGPSADGTVASTSTSMSSIGAIAVSSTGDIYFNEAWTRTVRKISAQTRIMTTYAGTGAAPAHANSGLGEVATAAPMHHINKLTFDRAGNLYIADLTCIRMVDASTGIVSREIGGGYAGDGGLAVNAEISTHVNVNSVAVSGSNDVYFSESNGRLRKVYAS